MMIGEFRQTIFQDSNLSLFQQSLNDQFSQIGKIPFINGVLLKSQPLTTGQANVINHRLGGQAKGYFITSNSANSTIWNSPFSGEISITLNCSANTTVDIWVW